MTEPVAGPSGPGTVVLDLGVDVGALILYTPADLDGAEIEISLDDAPGARRTHSAVRQRQRPGATARSGRAGASDGPGAGSGWARSSAPEGKASCEAGAYLAGKLAEAGPGSLSPPGSPWLLAPQPESGLVPPERHETGLPAH